MEGLDEGDVKEAGSCRTYASKGMKRGDLLGVTIDSLPVDLAVLSSWAWLK